MFKFCVLFIVDGLFVDKHRDFSCLVLLPKLILFKLILCRLTLPKLILLPTLYIGDKMIIKTACFGSWYELENGGRAPSKSRKFNKSNEMCLPNVADLFITL